VVFGTGHNLSDEFVALTRKRFETPLGQVPCDTAFVDRVAAALGERAYRRELVHRDEHSIEFQVIYLQRRLGARPWKLVPILCGGFHRLLDDGKTPRDEPVIETLVFAVRDAEATLGGPTLYVAGVDFSHVGPRFNDAKLDEETADLVQRIDEHAIAAAATGDADAWFQAIAEVDDRTRICGFAPTYCMLRAAAPGAGRPLAYAGSPEPDGTIVTVAAMAWP
jgi:AmmeMemoRadiSam system protein B